MEQNHGTIVGITSVAQVKGMPLNGTYCATKAALHIFLQGLRLDLVKTPIKIIEVAPGFIDTEMTNGNIDALFLVDTNLNDANLDGTLITSLAKP